MPTSQIHKPNFFILGAAKSGTTSAYHYLKQHPDIFLTEVKEPSFFYDGAQVVRNPITYFELYDAVSTEKVMGEASHVYLTNPSTARVLRGLFPDAKFVLVLRNPADRAFSHYHDLRRAGFEHFGSFEAALEGEQARYESKTFRVNCPHFFDDYLYFRTGLYGEQIQRYFSFFPKEQFHIITFDQFIADPGRHVSEMFKFLDVDPDYVPQFHLHNEGAVTARFPKLLYMARLLANMGKAIDKSVHGETPHPRAIRRSLMSLLNRANMKAMPSMRKETRARLLERYATDLQLLRELTGISFND